MDYRTTRRRPRPKPKTKAKKRPASKPKKLSGRWPESNKSAISRAAVLLNRLKLARKAEREYRNALSQLAGGVASRNGTIKALEAQLEAVKIELEDARQALHLEKASYSVREATVVAERDRFLGVVIMFARALLAASRDRDDNPQISTAIEAFEDGGILVGDGKPDLSEKVIALNCLAEAFSEYVLYKQGT